MAGAAAGMRKRAEETARTVGAKYNVSTDRSATEGLTKGGSGLVFISGDPFNPTVARGFLERGYLHVLLS